MRDDAHNLVIPDPSTRVTVIDNDPEHPLNIRPEERSLLALGPKFALSKIVDDTLASEVEVNLAHSVRTSVAGRNTGNRMITCQHGSPQSTSRRSSTNSRSNGHSSQLHLWKTQL